MEHDTASGSLNILSNCAKILVRRWYVLLLATVVSVGVVLGVAMHRAQSYTASARLIDLSDFSLQVYATADPGLIIEQVLVMLKSQQLAQEVFSRVEQASALGYSNPAELLALAKVYSVSKGTMVEIEVSHNDADFAEALVDTFADVAIDHLGIIYEESYQQSLQALEEQRQIAKRIYETAQSEYEKVVAETRLSEIELELEYSRGYIQTIAQSRNGSLAGILQGIRQSESLRRSATNLLLQLDGAEAELSYFTCVQLDVLLSRTCDLISDPGLGDLGNPDWTSSAPVAQTNYGRAVLPAEIVEPMCTSRETIEAALNEIIVLLEQYRAGLLNSMQSGLDAITRGQDWPLTEGGVTSTSSAVEANVEAALILSQTGMHERIQSLEQSLEHERSLLNTSKLDRDNAFRNYSHVVGQQSVSTRKAALSGLDLNRTEVTVSSAGKTPLAVYTMLSLVGGIILGSIGALSIEYGSRYRSYMDHR